MDGKSFCVASQSTLTDAINVIETIRERGVVIINAEDRVIGVLTLGDIIRILSRGGSMYSRIDKYMNRSYIYLFEHDLEKAFKLFQEKNLSFIPVVTEDHQLCSVITPREVMRYCVYERS